jgi:O-antigen/teichoic acid export membrane protein
MVAEALADIGFGDAIVQRAELRPDHLDTAFWVSSLLALFLVVVLVLAAGWISEAIGVPALAPVLAGLAACILLSGLSVVPQSLLRRSFRYKVLAMRAAVAVALGGAVGVAMALLGYGVWSLVGQQVTYYSALAAVVWLRSDWRPGFRLSRKALRQLSGFSLHVFANRWLHTLNSRLYDFLISASVGTSSAGHYAVGSRAPQMAQQLLTAPVSDVGLSLFSRLARDRVSQRAAYFRMVGPVMAICVPVFAGMAVVSDKLVIVVFGPQWEPAVGVMRALAVLSLFHSLEYANAPVIIGAGYPGLGWPINLTRLLVASVMFLVTHPLGLEVIAWGFAATALITTPMSCVFACRIVGISIVQLLREVLPSVITATFMVIGLFAIAQAGGRDGSPLVVLLVQVLAGAALYALTYRLLWRERANAVWSILASRRRP